MPVKKCSKRKSAPKCKPAAKRRSSITTRRSSTACKPRSRSTSACGARRASTASCVTGCRSPYMMTSSGRCGPVPCLDGNGNPLMGFVRNDRGDCAPKKCATGYVFNYATGKCVSQNSAIGQQLLAVKKYNDAQQAVREAEETMRLYKNPYDNGSDEHRTYSAMTGGIDKIGEVQKSYRQRILHEQKKRQDDYEKQLSTARELELQRSRLMSTPYSRSCSTKDNPYGALF